MPEIGQTVSHYRIIEKLGGGGMGVVYRAEDTNLHRRVAIKVLPDEFAHDAEWLGRFQREAQVLASLNHPNIATLYGLEESDGKRFIVMELVEGQTLAHRLLKSPLPVDEALEVCCQIAEGLEAAHEKGVIHRDLKPANVMITSDDKVKILDFGLARVYHDSTSDAVQTHSPTITEAMTRAGTILGTAAYMSPEQARGKPVDKRVDIWAFGCILFECLTGKRPFVGDTVTETLAAILKGEPNWAAFPPAATWKLRDLVRRCLRKDPRERLHDIADGRIEIVEALSQPAVREPVAAIKGLRTWRGIALFLGLLIVGMATAFTVILLRTPPAPIVRSNIDLPAGTQLTAGAEPTGKLLTQNRTELALSPDGRFLVYSAGADGLESKAKLYLRAMNRAKAEEIQGTEGGRTPFFSPDGQWLGF